jgi:hypothetical protein
MRVSVCQALNEINGNAARTNGEHPRWTTPCPKALSIKFVDQSSEKRHNCRIKDINMNSLFHKRVLSMFAVLGKLQMKVGILKENAL